MTPARCPLRALLLTLCLVGCSRHADGPSPAGDGGAEGGAGRDLLRAVARAEDTRRSADVPREARSHRDVAVRRASARAYARIQDATSRDALLEQVADEDAEVATWSAYGLGAACRGHEEATVKALAAKLASVAPAKGPAPMRGRAELDLATSVARAIGRCGGPLAEQTLLGLARQRAGLERAGLFGLGDVAVRRKRLDESIVTALVDLTSSRSEGGPLDLAFYALSRVTPPEALGTRIMEAARSALERPGEARLFAIKALARAVPRAKEASASLSRVVLDDKGFDAAERGEAARGLGLLGEAGHEAATTALARLVPDRDPVAIQNLMGPSFHVLATLVASLGPEPPKRIESTLFALASLEAPKAPSPGLGRRLAELRCGAAAALARGAVDSEVLRKCDDPKSVVAQRARMTSLLRKPLVGERRGMFRALAQSEHLRVREAAVEALSTHPEAGEMAVTILESALSSKKAGLVAAAASVLHAHPERAFVLAEREKRAALDPRAPPPSATPQQELAPPVLRALTAALVEPWPADRFETRLALLEAAATVRHPAAVKTAQAACLDGNTVVRERAQKALRTLGESTAACDGPQRPVTVAAELEAPLAAPARVELDTDVGTLVITLEPELAPVTAARLAALARAGFYTGIVVHRVVPGFVVQLGDPDGDGYGGSGTPLRCETSPVHFHALDVGMALAGRDTGSSQFFVTLAATPHLDGDYTRVGRAEGDWASVAEGDVVAAARLRE